MSIPQWTSVLTGLAAAICWGVSAFVKIPRLMETKLNGKDSLTSIMQRQSFWSAIAAGLTAASVLAQAWANSVAAQSGPPA